MTTYGLTDDGYTAPRAADFLTIIRSAYETETGLTIDWDRDTFLGNMTVIMANQLGSLSEETQALYDAFDVNNATGIQLSNLALLVGVVRNQPTSSTATITATGTEGTFIGAGSLVEGGGANDDAQWRTLADATIAVGDTTVDIAVEATVAGEIVATAGQIDRIVTPVSGWSSVTNAADATPGQDLESDAELRKRRQASLQIAGSSSIKAIRANLLALDYIESAAVLDNDQPFAQFVQGIFMDPNSIAVILLPSSITAEQQDEVAETIWEHSTAGIQLIGTDVTKTVTAADGFAKTVKWDWGEELTVNVATTVVLATGFSLSDVEEPIQQLVVDFFDTLVMGQAVDDLDIECLAATVDGVRRATVTLNGSNTVEPNINQLAVLGTNTVTT